MKLAGLWKSMGIAVVALASTAVMGADAPGKIETRGKEQIITAYTAPAQGQRSEMAFRTPGIVKAILCKPGDKVKVGQVLVQQDDSVERKQWESLERQANQQSSVQIEAAESEAKYKQAKLKRITEMHNSSVASQTELEEAQLDAELSLKKIAVAKEEQAYKKLDAAAKGSQVEQMKLIAQFDGEVERIDTALGQLADYQRPCIVIVQNDPLYVILNLPNRMTDKLATGDAMEVRYGETEPWQTASVDFMSPSANAEAFKRIVKLKLPNPQHKASGYSVQVKLPEKLTEVQTAGAR